jgi:hypothetical protein
MQSKSFEFEITVNLRDFRLTYYEAYDGSYLPTFRDSLSVTSQVPCRLIYL